MHSRDQIITSSFKQLRVLFGKHSSLFSGHLFDHFLLHLSCFYRLVFHYQALDYHDRTENHTSEYCVFESYTPT